MPTEIEQIDAEVKRTRSDLFLLHYHADLILEEIAIILSADVGEINGGAVRIAVDHKENEIRLLREKQSQIEARRYDLLIEWVSLLGEEEDQRVSVIRPKGKLIQMPERSVS